MLKLTLYAVMFIVAAGIAVFFGMGLYSQSGSAPGLVDNRLASCPGSPNCVSSEDGTDSEKSVKSLPNDAWEKVPDAIAAMGGSVVTQDENYLAAEFKSSVFGFVDDVEFRKADDAVHVRSASRVGYSDAGVNAARVGELRKRLSD